MGQVLEGSSSNFFALLNGVLRTAGDGVLAGVTRGIVLEAAKGLLPIVTEPISLNDMPNLREAFITSISRAVLPVVAIDAEVVGSGVPGPYTREIIQRFNARLERELEPIS
jgi:branched-chain amino acid aminotransferase